MKKIWSGIQLLVIITIMSGCGMKGKETSETNEVQKSTVQSTVKSIKLDVPEEIETEENGMFSITGKTEPKTDVDISFGVSDTVITSDENGNFKYDGYSLSDEKNSYPVYVSVNTNTESEVEKEITVIRSDESIKKIANEKARERQKSSKESNQVKSSELSLDDKINLKRQYLEILKKQLSSTLEVSLDEDMSIYDFKPIEGGEFLLATAEMLNGGDSSAWYSIKETLSIQCKQLSELLDDDVSFTFTYEDSKTPMLLIINGMEIFDNIDSALVEKGYK